MRRLKFLLRIPRGTIKVALYLIFIGIILFVGATRTQVGRNGLKAQIENQFDELFAGSLEIGSLTGNLANQFVASDVLLKDDHGLVVAVLDTIDVQPYWFDLLRNQYRFKKVRLRSGTIRLIETDGSWNILEAVAPLTKQGNSERPFLSSAANVSIERLSIITESDFPPPSHIANDLLFDYKNSFLFVEQARLTVDWENESHQIDLLDATNVRLGDSELFQQARGQFVIESGRTNINDLTIISNQGTISGDGSLGNYSGFAPDASPQSVAEVDFDLEDISPALARRIIPKWPFDKSIRTTVSGAGPLHDFAFTKLDFSTGSSSIKSFGKVSGYPDSLRYNIASEATSLLASDINELLPGLAIENFFFSDATAKLQSTGTMYLKSDSIQAQHDLFVASNIGSVEVHATTESGSFNIRQATRFEADIASENLDLSAIVPARKFAGLLTGWGKVTGVLTDGSVDGDFSGVFAGLEINGAPVDSAHLHLDKSGQDYSFGAQLIRGEETLETKGTAFRSQEVFRLTASTGVSELNLGSWLQNDSLFSEVAASIAFDVSRQSRETLDLVATLTTDSSVVTIGEEQRIIRPGTSRIVFSSRADSTKLDVSGSLANAKVVADGSLPTIQAHYFDWRQDIAAKARNIWDKPYFIVQDSAGSQQTTHPKTLGRTRLVGELRLRDFQSLSAMLVGLPSIGTDAVIRLDLLAGSDQFEGNVNARADSLALKGFLVRNGAVRSELRATKFSDSFDLHVDANAQSLRLAEQTIPQPDISLEANQNRSTYRISSQSDSSGNGLAIRGVAEFLPDKNRLVLSQTDFNSNLYLFGLRDRAIIDVYRDAISIQPFRFVERDSSATEERSLAFVEVDGTYSPSPADTLRIASSGVQLREVSSFLGWRKLVGGAMDADLKIAKGLNSPSVQGNVFVSNFSHGIYHLGDLSVNTRYLPNSDALALDIIVTETQSEPEGPVALLASKTNELRIGGTYRPGGNGSSRETLDLEASIERADMFFFEYIFPRTVQNVRGYVSGRGRISGSFSKPRFDADLTVNEGNFDVPDFNINYDVSGSVDVDESGVHIRRATVEDGRNGRALITGSVSFNDYKFFSLDLVGRIDSLQIMNIVSSRDLPFFGDIAASGTASLTGPLSNASLTSRDARTTADSDVYIPLVAASAVSDESFIVFADSSGAIPDIAKNQARKNVLSKRPSGERSFLDGLEMDLNVNAPPGSTIHLVIDPLLGDVINAVGSGRVQLTRTGGQFQTFGRLDVTGGDYLFTAGELFIRRFLIDPGGSITWDGDPINASLNIPASYKTRASRAGLPVAEGGSSSLIPVTVRLDITGRVATPEVALRLEIDADQRGVSNNYEAIETILNQTERSTEYATSVLLTNSFLLTTAGPSTDALASSAFTSVSQLVASQVNRYLSEALPNIDFSFGVSGQSTQDLDVTYGIGLRLLDERLVIRGQGVYQGTRSTIDEVQSLQGEFVVEVRLNPNVSVEVFYRREGDALTDEAFVTNTTGAGLSYQTEFATWRRFFERIVSRPDDSRGTSPSQGVNPINSSVNGKK